MSSQMYKEEQLYQYFRDNPCKFAEIFCNAVQQQRLIDDVFTTKIIELLNQNKNIRDRIKLLQKEVINETRIKFIKKIGLISWFTLMISIGMVIGLYL